MDVDSSQSLILILLLGLPTIVATKTRTHLAEAVGDGVHVEGPVLVEALHRAVVRVHDAARPVPHRRGVVKGHAARAGVVADAADEEEETQQQERRGGKRLWPTPRAAGVRGG